MRAAVILLVMCFIALGPSPAQAQRGLAATGGVSATAGTGLQSPGTAALQSLSDDEAEWLIYMWEEERLALEVYTKFSETWDLPIFAKIAASEAKHVAAVRTLIDRYSLSVPGEFSGEFQQLYIDLLEQGLTLEGALEAGVAIEEKDIADLTLAVTDTDNKDILRVYANLLAASQTHLAAFTRQLDVESLTAGVCR